MIAIMIPTPIMTRLLLFMAFSLKRRLPQTPAPSSARILPILFVRRLDMSFENSYGPVAAAGHSP